MAPPYTSYEPLPGGKGYRLYDQEGKPSLYATTPAVEDFVRGLQPRNQGDMLAANGAGGGGGASGGDDTQPPAPAPVAADYGPPPGMSGPAMSRPEENVSREPPPAPPPPPAAPATGGGNVNLYGRPPAPGGGAPADEPISLDPSQIQRSPMSAEERELRAIEDARFRQLATTPASPVRKIPATWQPSSRSFEERERPMADLEELRAAQRAAAESEGLIAEERAKAEEQQRQLEAQRSARDIEFQARQDAATRKFQEETGKIEADLEAERKALKSPGDFWENTSTANQVALAIFAGLGGAGGAINGDPEAGGRIIQNALNAHVARRQKNVEALVAKRGRGKEDFDLQNAALQAERATAMRQIDEQVKAAISQGQNPILRSLMEEDVPITPEAVEASLMKGAKSDVGLDTAEKRLVFERGPDGELRPRENAVRYLLAEHAKNQARLQAARENLGYAREYASVQQRSEKYIPERMTGGGGGLSAAMKLREQQIKDRIKRGESVTDQDLKAAGILGPLAGTRQKASAEREEKEGARTFVVPSAGAGKPTEYVARPGTSEKEMQDLRAIAGDIRSMEEAIKILDEESSAKNKFVDNPRVTMAAKTFAGLSGTAVFNSGIVNPSELDAVVGTANNLGSMGPSGVRALKDVVNVAKLRYAERARQIGAKPKGGRLWPRRRPRSHLPRSLSRSRMRRGRRTPSTRASWTATSAAAATRLRRHNSSLPSRGRSRSPPPPAARRWSAPRRLSSGSPPSRQTPRARRRRRRRRRSGATGAPSRAPERCRSACSRASPAQCLR